MAYFLFEKEMSVGLYVYQNETVQTGYSNTPFDCFDIGKFTNTSYLHEASLHDNEKSICVYLEF